MKKTAFITALLSLAAASATVGQTPSAPHHPNNRLPQWVTDNQTKRVEFERLTRERGPGEPMIKRTGRRPSQRQGSAAPTPAEVFEMLRPPKTYFEKYERFLRDSDAGILRIYPDNGCDKGMTVSVEALEKCASAIPVKGAGSLFSFRLRNHSSFLPDFWDIHFVDGTIEGGNSTVQVIFVETDVADVAEIGNRHASITALGEYEPKVSKTGIKAEAAELAKGASVDGVRFSNRVATSFDGVIAARVIAYFEDGRTGPLANSIYSGKGLDLHLVFQIVGRESDGSLVVLWKELKRDLPRKKLSD